ncbi:efflux transporter periplasmic adaptor subunit [Flavobacterium cheongpyeongense]|uniref:Efflux transporter periplasmic adaptor subunit n=1 Tax=Flavobacterium cheongpyeongense TaxID=2212651 RepID=A0A2V4BNE6_9FLAO|nr:efflux RND transporter periplasmic adaptor subunit [Flavobacterium cheongpyeongense]PXY39150.1 efflux transporter periplasmic adaptor subunit [Flavobacterium cheongpyeongense]
MKNISLLLSMLFILNGCKNITEKQEIKVKPERENSVTLTDAQFRNANITTTQLTQENIATTIKLNGKIDVPPQNLVSVNAPMGGYLVNSKLLPGMLVKKGEIIATLQDPQYIQLQQDYLMAKSKLHFAELEFSRQKDLNQTKASSDKVTQLAESEVNNLRITVNALSEKLKLINIKATNLSADKISKNIVILSTITGFVSKVNINIGKYIAPAEVMFELIDPDDIHLSLNVFDKDIAKLAIGQRVISYSNAAPNKKHECNIILINKDLNVTGNTQVHCHFKKYDKDLLPGMYMNAEIETTSGLVNALPELSIVNFESKEYVFIETKKQQYVMTAVSVGVKKNGYLEILNPEELKNKKIVRTGAYTLLMKMKNKEE